MKITKLPSNLRRDHPWAVVCDEICGLPTDIPKVLLIAVRLQQTTTLIYLLIYLHHYSMHRCGKQKCRVKKVVNRSSSDFDNRHLVRIYNRRWNATTKHALFCDRRDSQVGHMDVVRFTWIGIDSRSFWYVTEWKVSRHFVPRTLRTQDISSSFDWCRSVRTVRHQYRNVPRTLRHWYRTVSLDLQQTFFCCSRPLSIILKGSWLRT